MRYLLFILLLICGYAHSHIRTTFLSEVCIKPYQNYHYHVCKDINFLINDNNFTIPAGFETDLSRIPRIAWDFMSPDHSSWIKAAIVHDWFYRMTCDFDRKQTDLIFYHMLINDGVYSFRASIMYYTARVFGSKFYNEDYCE